MLDKVDMNKKQIYKILILSLLVIVLGIATILLPKIKTTPGKKAAFGSVNVRVVPSSVSKVQGEEFEVEIKMEAGEHQVSGADLKLSFNTEQLQIVNFTPGPSLPVNLTPSNFGNSTGTLRVIVLNRESDLPSGTFVVGRVRLKGIMPSGPTPFTLSVNKAASQVVGQSTTSDVVLSIAQTTNGSFQIAAPSDDGDQEEGDGDTGDDGQADEGEQEAGDSPDLNFKVKFQGVTGKRDDQKVKVIVRKGSFEKVFEEVTVSSDDNGVFSGSVALAGVAPGSGYTIFVKGPRHLAAKFIENEQTERASFSGEGSISLGAGDNDFDFTGLDLPFGDLPDPNHDWKQDGVINVVDYSLLKSRLGKSSAEDLRVGDCHFDGTVNTACILDMRINLETMYGPEM